jgi:hypothetical protein
LIEIGKSGQVLLAVGLLATLETQLNLQGQQLLKQGAPIIADARAEIILDAWPSLVCPLGLESLAGMVNPAGLRERCGEIPVTRDSGHQSTPI